MPSTSSASITVKDMWELFLKVFNGHLIYLLLFNSPKFTDNVDTPLSDLKGVLPHDQ